MNPLDTPPLTHKTRLKSYQGRFGRLSYIAWHLILWWAAICIGFGLLISLGIFNFATFSFESSAYILPAINNIFSLLFVLIYTYFAFVITIRRLHDVNLSGWWSLLGFIPLLNFFFHLYLLLKKGDLYTNRYAPVRQTPFWEKILACLGIIFSITILISFMMLISSFIGSIHFFPTQIWLEKSSDFF
jgi:uncharacterized membrane protein YhaH (DUF805 family)